jgi:hypothetical protein
MDFLRANLDWLHERLQPMMQGPPHCGARFAHAAMQL